MRIVVCVDFDGTLALGNKGYITLAEPNYKLIERLQNLKKTINPYIKIVTARGAKNNLKYKEKQKKYQHLIEQFCNMYDIPYDEISFNKEYADIYVDDMTIDQHSEFTGQISPITLNNIIFTEKAVIKKSQSSLFEKQWYDLASKKFNTPQVLFCNDETIITERLLDTQKVDIQDYIDLLRQFQNSTINNYNYDTYLNNIIIDENLSKNGKDIILEIQHKKLKPTFFHGDFSVDNILKVNNSLFMIDPNYKYIFGNYITDAAKLYFSIVAYEKNIHKADQLVKEFGKDVIAYAIPEGLRVCKYKKNYISIVNNIAEIYKRVG